MWNDVLRLVMCKIDLIISVMLLTVWFFVFVEP